MRVIHADVVALRLSHAEHCPGLQIEFVNADIFRQPILLLRGDVGEIGIGRAEMTIHERTDEAFFKIAINAWTRERQGGVDRQPFFLVGNDAFVQRVQ
jgi:hypothetical protein